MIFQAQVFKTPLLYVPEVVLISALQQLDDLLESVYLILHAANKKQS